MNHTLYRFFNSRGQLLYVGITVNPAARFRDHRQQQRWWDEVRGIGLTQYATREELAAAEIRAIQTEHPAYNVAGSIDTGCSLGHRWDCESTRYYACYCGKDAIYHQNIDRLFHVDGTDNIECWAAFSSGKADVNPRRTVEVTV